MLYVKCNVRSICREDRRVSVVMAVGGYRSLNCVSGLSGKPVVLLYYASEEVSACMNRPWVMV